MVVALLPLLVGPLAHLAPTAAGSGPVSVVWPEATVFNADESDYAVAVDWDGAGSVFLVYKSPGDWLSLQEIESPGETLVEFPSVDEPVAQRWIDVYSCPGGFFQVGECTLAGGSPPLTVSRSDAASDHANPGVTVTWPTTTTINPDTTPYVVDVDWTGAGTVFVVTSTGSHANDIPTFDEVFRPGHRVVEFPEAAADQLSTVSIWWCSEGAYELVAEGCSYVDSVRDLRIWRKFDVATVGCCATPLGPGTPYEFQIQPSTAESLDIDWQLRDFDSGELAASGSVTNVAATGPLPPLGALDLMEHKWYRLHLDISGDVEPVGRLYGHLDANVSWDSTNDSFLTVGTRRGDGSIVSRTTVYPVIDGYRDDLRFIADSSDHDLQSMAVIVHNAAGDVVFEGAASRDNLTRNVPFIWNGRDAAGGLLPNGVYDITATTLDHAGNEAAASASVHVSDRRIVPEVWSRTFAPARLPAAKVIAACAHLEQPARPEWPRSLGYYSSSDCDDSVRSRIVVSHRVEAPPSIGGRYGRVRLVVQGAGGANALSSRLALTYFSSARDAATGFTAGGSLGRHVGPWIEDLVHHEGDRRFVRWTAGTTRGDQYDVKSYTVQIEYDVLE